jgi:hypothetical protein
MDVMKKLLIEEDFICLIHDLNSRKIREQAVFPNDYMKKIANLNWF